jgi:hypothetical protein
MTITVMYEARCDFCTALYSMGRVNITTDSIFKKNFIDQLRHEGWSIGKYITCPECKTDGRNYHKRPRLPERRHFDTPSSIAIP